MSLTITNGASTAPPASSNADSSNSVSDDLATQFLSMLVAQMQNQDPLNPMDNAQLTSQLAQISTVNGISSLNDTVTGLGANLATVQSMQAAALVGREVEVPGKTLTLKEGGTATGGFDVPYAVENATISITNSSGEVVYTESMANVPAGTTHFSWDGKTTAGSTAPAGDYTFSVQLRAGGVEGAADTVSVVKVQSVQPSASGTNVIDASGKAYALSSVRQIS